MKDFVLRNQMYSDEIKIKELLQKFDNAFLLSFADTFSRQLKDVNIMSVHQQFYSLILYRKCLYFLITLLIIRINKGM